jgi:hypothetical protein
MNEPISERQFDFDDILNRVTIRDILEHAGIQAITNRITCPLHEGANPTSFSFSDTGFVCFSCGAKGGLLNLVEALLGLNRSQAMEYLCGLAGIPNPGCDSGPTRSAKPKHRTRLRQSDPILDKAKERLEWMELYREGLSRYLQILRRRVRAGLMDSATFYSKEQYCQYQLEETDSAVSRLAYEYHQTMRNNKK